MIVNDCIWMTITIEKQQYNNLNNRIEDNCTTTSDQDDNDSDCNTSCCSNYTLITHNKKRQTTVSVYDYILITTK